MVVWSPRVVTIGGGSGRVDVIFFRCLAARLQTNGSAFPFGRTVVDILAGGCDRIRCAIRDGGEEATSPIVLFTIGPRSAWGTGRCRSSGRDRIATCRPKRQRGGTEQCGAPSSGTSRARCTNGTGSRRRTSTSSVRSASTPMTPCAPPRSRRSCWTDLPPRPPCSDGAGTTLAAATAACSLTGSAAPSRNRTGASGTGRPCGFPPPRS